MNLTLVFCCEVVLSDPLALSQCPYMLSILRCLDSSLLTYICSLSNPGTIVCYFSCGLTLSCYLQIFLTLKLLLLQTTAYHHSPLIMMNSLIHSLLTYRSREQGFEPWGNVINHSSCREHNASIELTLHEIKHSQTIEPQEHGSEVQLCIVSHCEAGVEPLIEINVDKVGHEAAGEAPTLADCEVPFHAGPVCLSFT